MAFSPSGRPSVARSKLIRGKLPENKDEHRINERIRVPEVRLISEKGEQIGIVPTRDALRRAKELGLDLMEVAPNARPPVCKILDYGKFKYEKKKKETTAKKKQSTIKVKEIQLRPNTDEHDLKYKMENFKKFLEGGDKVKITMIFKGRQMAHTQIGMRLMQEIRTKMLEFGTVEYEPRMEGRKIIMIFAPVVKKPPKGKTEDEAPKAEKEVQPGTTQGKAPVKAKAKSA